MAVRSIADELRLSRSWKIYVKFLFFTLYDSSVEKPEKTDRTSTETTGNEKTPASAEQTTEEHTPESVGTPKLIEAEDPTAFSATAADVESAAEREDSGIPEPGTPELAGEAPGRLRIVCTHFYKNPVHSPKDL